MFCFPLKGLFYDTEHIPSTSIIGNNIRTASKYDLPFPIGSKYQNTISVGVSHLNNLYSRFEGDRPTQFAELKEKKTHIPTKCRTV